MSDDLSAIHLARDRQVSARRIGLAFIIAPLVPALMLSFLTLVGGADLGTFLRIVALIVGIGGYPAALLFGVPMLLVLKRFDRLQFAWVVFGGGLVAIAPWVLMTLVTSPPESEWNGEHLTFQNGSRTLWGWIEAVRVFGMIFALGAVGGLTFWLVGIFRFDVRKRTSHGPSL